MALVFDRLFINSILPWQRKDSASKLVHADKREVLSSSAEVPGWVKGLAGPAGPNCGTMIKNKMIASSIQILY